MATPKISGEFMDEVCENDWEYCTNDLVINVYGIVGDTHHTTYYLWSIKYKGVLINEPMECNVKTPQEGADQAVKFLHGLRNIINYIE